MSTQHTFDPQEVARYEHVTWSRCAPTYADTFGVLSAEAIGPLLDATGVARGSLVLDVGTGPGLVAAAVAGRGGGVTGIDFSEAMLAEARRRYPAIEFRQASADDLPFPDAAFDVVVSNLVVHHLGRPEQFLQEAHRVLRAGGRVGFTVWADPAKLEAMGIFFAAVAEHAEAAELPHGPLFGVSDFAFFRQMVHDAGFRDAAVREVPIAWRMTSAEPLVVGFRDWADMGAWPAETRAAVEAAVRDGAGAYAADGAYTMPCPVIMVTAVK